MRAFRKVAIGFCSRWAALAVCTIMTSASLARADEPAASLTELLQQAEAKRSQLLYDDAIALLRQIGDRAEEDRRGSIAKCAIM